MELNVIAQIKIYVDDPASIDSVKKEIEGIVKVQKFWEEEVGFGIKALKASVLLADSEEGGMEKVEQQITALEHVSQMEVESVERV
ncbi:hypothetical protein JXA56_00110 [Candidatus Micrarchaeota archaeon]|nr:hypothetical protein [Candidatus Micrarchaeota archaeon]